MFLGQFIHSLDDKGRLMIPVRYRDQLIPDGAYVMQGFDKNLIVLPSSNYQELSHQVGQLSLTDSKARLLKRLVFSTADRIEFDKAGRILIPQFLRYFAGLENEIIVVGMGHFFELWSPEAWNEQSAQLQEIQTNPDRFSTHNLSIG